MIENEIKLVLRLDLADRLDDYPELAALDMRFLIQGYHSGGGRLRRDVIPTVSATNTFNYKIDLPSGEMEEFEMQIDDDAFDRAIAMCNITLRKKRITLVCDEYTWDLDLFVNERDHVTFVMVECEMPAGGELPPMDQWPSFVSENLVMVVPQENTEYSSKKLAKPDHMAKLWMRHYRQEVAASTINQITATIIGAA